MNNIIDQTTMTGDAVFGTTLEVADGKLKIRSQGITSNELAANAVKTIAIEDANVTQAKLGSNVVGTGSSTKVKRTTDQFINDSTETKLSFNTLEFGNSGNEFNLSTSTYTVPVTGVYLINVEIGFANNGTAIAERYVQLYVNGASSKRLYQLNPLTFSAIDYSLGNGSLLAYLSAGTNLEIYGYLNTNGGQAKISLAEFSAILLAKL
jgi:hypothetical protein